MRQSLHHKLVIALAVVVLLVGLAVLGERSAAEEITTGTGMLDLNVPSSVNAGSEVEIGALLSYPYNAFGESSHARLVIKNLRTGQLISGSSTYDSNSTQLRLKGTFRDRVQETTTYEVLLAGPFGSTPLHTFTIEAKPVVIVETPVLVKEFTPLTLTPSGESKTIDLTQHIRTSSGQQLDFAIESPSPIVSAKLDGNKLLIIPNTEGRVEILIKANNHDKFITAVQQVTVSVRTNTDEDDLSEELTTIKDTATVDDDATTSPTPSQDSASDSTDTDSKQLDISFRGSSTITFREEVPYQLNLTDTIFIDGISAEAPKTTFSLNRTATDNSIITISRSYDVIRIIPLRNGKTQLGIIAQRDGASKQRLYTIVVDVDGWREQETLVAPLTKPTNATGSNLTTRPMVPINQSRNAEPVYSGTDATSPAFNASLNSTLATAHSLPPLTRQELLERVERKFAIEQPEEVVAEEISDTRIRRVVRQENKMIEQVIAVVEQETPSQEDVIRVKDLVVQRSNIIEPDREPTGTNETFTRRQERAAQAVHLQKALVIESQTDEETQKTSTTSTVVLTITPRDTVTGEPLEIIEVIPKEVAFSAQDILFNIEPIILEDDPVVMWQLEDLEEVVEITYTVDKQIETTGNTVALAQEATSSASVTATDTVAESEVIRTPWQVIRPLLLIPFIVLAILYLGRGHKQEPLKKF